MMKSGPHRRLLLGTALAAPFIHTAAAAEPMTIWHDLGDNGAKWFAAMAETFAASHPGFTLRPTNYPTDQWFGRVIGAVNTDTAPDLIFNNYERVIRVAAQTGRLMDLEATLDQVPDTTFLSGDDRRVATYDGHMIILPVQRVQMGFGIRKSWLAHVGETFPVTWDDTKRVAEKFRDNHPDGDPKSPTFAFAMQASTPRGLIHMLDLFIFGSGLKHSLIDPTGKIVIDETRHALVLEEFLKIFTSYKFVPPDTVNYSFNEMYQVIEGGRAGMFRVGDWNVSKWDKQALNGDFEAGPWPKFFPDTPGGVVIGGMRGVAVPENSPHKTLALEFATFMLSPPAQQASLAIMGSAVRKDLDVSGLSDRARFFAKPAGTLYAYDFPESVQTWYPELEAGFHRKLMGGIANPPADWKPFINETAREMRTMSDQLASKKG